MHRLRDTALRVLAPQLRSIASNPGNTILIIQPDHLGDIILSQPAAKAIRERFQNHHIVALVGPWSEHIARRTWPVDEVLTIDFPAFRRAENNQNPLYPYQALMSARDALRPLDVSRAFILRPDDWWSAWLAHSITAGPVVTALDRRMDPFATVQVEVSRLPHATQKAHAISVEGKNVHPLTAQTPSYPKSELASNRARELRASVGIMADYAVIHPGSGADVKLWVVERWRQVATHLTSIGLQVLITGGPGEIQVAAEVARELPSVVSLAGMTGLDELAEIMRDARIVAGPDCGPLHLAVACDTPTLHLFGPSDPARYGPWGPAEFHRVVTSGWSCSMCDNLSQDRPAGCGCMLAISAEVVIQEIDQLLQRAHATS
jgi:heptosyltransferase III